MARVVMVFVILKRVFAASFARVPLGAQGMDIIFNTSFLSIRSS